MPAVRVRVRVEGGEPAKALGEVTAFRRWPELSDAVESVRIEADGDAASRSHWEVHFREGLLKWSQRDRVDLERGICTFDLIEGDPLVFNGSWTAEAAGGGCVLEMDAEFDLGMPSLSHVLDPMAVEALEDTVESVIRGLYGDGAEVVVGGDQRGEE